MAAVEADWKTAPIREHVRAVLEFLTDFVPSDGVVATSTMKKLKNHGLSSGEIKEAMTIAWCFIIISKWADALDFPLTPPDVFRPIGKMMYRFGYKGVSVGTPW